MNSKVLKKRKEKVNAVEEEAVAVKEEAVAVKEEAVAVKEEAVVVKEVVENSMEMKKEAIMNIIRMMISRRVKDLTSKEKETTKAFTKSIKERKRHLIKVINNKPMNRRKSLLLIKSLTLLLTRILKKRNSLNGTLLASSD